MVLDRGYKKADYKKSWVFSLFTSTILLEGDGVFGNINQSSKRESFITTRQPPQNMANIFHDAIPDKGIEKI